LPIAPAVVSSTTPRGGCPLIRQPHSTPILWRPRPPPGAVQRSDSAPDRGPRPLLTHDPSPRSRGGKGSYRHDQAAPKQHLMPRSESSEKSERSARSKLTSSSRRHMPGSQR
jgi:hypothetical protein